MIKTEPARAVTWRGKPVPESFIRFTSGFHQDAFKIYGTLDAATLAAVDFVYPKERTELSAYLRKVLSEKFDDSDIKGLWNRTNTNFFVSGSGVRQVLEAALKRLIELEQP